MFAFFIFIITISLSIISIRQRKSNQILGEIVAQTKVHKVHNAEIYSNIGVGIRDGSYVSKCPACAEWINLEATICKFCQNKVESTNLKLREAMQEIDNNIAEANFAYNRRLQEEKEALREQRKERRKALLRSPLFRGSMAIILIIAITLIGIRVQSTFSQKAAYNKATAMPSSASELAKSWKSIIEECEILDEFYVLNVGDQKVKLSILISENFLDPYGQTTSTAGAVCFSKKAFAIDVLKKFGRVSGNQWYYLQNDFQVNMRSDLYGNGYVIEFTWYSR